MSRTEQLIIRTPDDFSLQENLEYLSRSADECMFNIQDGRVSRAINAEGKPVLFCMEGHPEGILVTLNGEADGAAAGVERFVRDWLDLGRDLMLFYQLGERDPLLRDAVSRHRGLRVVGIPDLFETFVWAILGQQITVAFAYVLKRRFVERFGKVIEADGVKHYLFPSAEKVASLEPEALRELKITARKSEYIIGVARLIAEGGLTKERLQSLGDDRAIEHHLTAIRGIGPWTANYVLMRCLRSPDAYPAADVGLHNALKLVAGLGRKPTLPEVEAFAGPWKGWRAYATFYLWRYLNSEAERG